MKLNNLRGNYLVFVIAYLLTVVIFVLSSYRFFIADFISLEEKLNKNNIVVFVKTMDKTLTSLKKITVDYSVWDDTYAFVEDKYSQYIYKNFREGSDTLEDLDIDNFFIANLKNNSLLSIYNERITYLEDKKEFEKTVFKKLEKYKDFSGLLKYNSHIFYVVKTSIYKSDRSGNSNGYIITIKFIDGMQLYQDNSSVFNSLSIIDKMPPLEVKPLDFKLKELKNIMISSDYTTGKVISYISFFDDNKHIFSIKTSNENLVISNAKRAIVIFNLITAFILLVIFIMLYKNQRLILDQNRILNRRIIKRTKQLNKAFKSLKNKNRALYKLANIDSLTMINNRASYFEKSINLLKESNKTYSEFAILMIDIDYFKRINDKYGHAIGDKVLIEFSNLVKRVIPEDMIFGRIGGEEFCITIFNRKREYVEKLSEEIREKCFENKLLIDKETITFTVSIGMAFKENGIQTIDQILQEADIRLYKAKKTGRNRVIRQG